LDKPVKSVLILPHPDLKKLKVLFFDTCVGSICFDKPCEKIAFQYLKVKCFW